MAELTLILDSKYRISLKKLLKFPKTGSVKARVLKNGDIILKPMVSIPAREAWLYQDKEALESVQRGLSQEGKIDRGSFAQYVDEG
jgi:hypothetical protein